MPGQTCVLVRVVRTKTKEDTLFGESVGSKDLFACFWLMLGTMMSIFSVAVRTEEQIMMLLVPVRTECKFRARASDNSDFVWVVFWRPFFGELAEKFSHMPQDGLTRSYFWSKIQIQNSNRGKTCRIQKVVVHAPLLFHTIVVLDNHCILFSIVVSVLEQTHTQQII